MDDLCLYGRRFAVIDPLCEKYPHLSPYAYCGNDPVNAVDINGDSIVLISSFGNMFLYDLYTGSYSDYTGNLNKNTIGEDSDKSIFNQAIIDLRSKPEGNKLVEELALSEAIVFVRVTHKTYDNNRESDYEYMNKIGSGIVWNPDSPPVEGGKPFVSLSHEMFHSRDRIKNQLNTSVWKRVETEKGWVVILKCEKDALDNENKIRKEHNLPPRKKYEQDCIIY